MRPTFVAPVNVNYSANIKQKAHITVFFSFIFKI